MLKRARTPLVKLPSPESNKGRVKQSIRDLVWKKHFGHHVAICYCCGERQISALDFECGHIVPRARGGPDSVDNLLPICGSCNRSMGTMNLRDYQKFHKLPVNKYRHFRTYHPCISSFIMGLGLSFIIFTAMCYYYFYWLKPETSYWKWLKI